MKKNYLIMCGLALALASCNKDVVTATSPEKSSKAIEFQVIQGNQKATLLSQMSSDKLFIDYIKTIMDVEKYHQQLLENSPNFDIKKQKELPKAKSEKELVERMKTVGYINPETLIEKFKNTRSKLIEVYKKYPEFAKSFTDEEKKEFYKKTINQIQEKR